MAAENTQPNVRKTEGVVTKNGHSLKAFKDDLITQRIKKRGIYEGLPLGLISKILKKIDRPVVFDVGANIGNHSLSFAMNAHQVYSFEPIKITFDLLQENARRNNLHNVNCYNCGFSDADAFAEIFVDETGNIGGSSLEHEGEKSKPETIKLVSGDGWVTSSDSSVTKVDFVKIDVEGHEPKVLKGLKSTLQKFRPVVMLEYNEEPSIKVFKEMNLFDSYFAGYEVFVLGNSYDPEYHEDKGSTKFRRFLTRLLSRKAAKLYAFDPSRCYHNILMVPKEKLSILPKESLT